MNTATAPADDLRVLLRHCSPSTYLAAVRFRAERDPALLPAILYGIIEHYVARSLRPKLQAPAHEVRLVEDLALDSLTLMELVILVDATLELSLQPDELPRLRTLSDLQHFIAAKLTCPR